MAPLQRLQLAWAQARLKPKLEHGPFVGAAELLTIGTARLLATGEAGRAAGWAVEVVGYIGLVFWQAHGAGADCHEVLPKVEPRSVARLDWRQWRHGQGNVAALGRRLGKVANFVIARVSRRDYERLVINQHHANVFQPARKK